MGIDVMSHNLSVVEVAVIRDGSAMADMWNPGVLSDAARVVWAKSKHDSDEWLPLWQHLSDAARVAELLWDHWIPDRVRRVIAESLPGGMADARRLVVWQAGVHDIGKATPSFTVQVPRLAEAGVDYGLKFRRDRKEYPREAHHTITGQVILSNWLQQRHGWKRRPAQAFSVSVGGHHGTPSTGEKLASVRNHPAATGWEDDGSTPWSQVQWKLLDWVADSSEVTDRLPCWETVKLSQHTQVLLTAIVIMADWIASNEDFFPYLAMDRSSVEDRIASGWADVALPARWRARDVPASNGELYRSRFGMKSPRSIQTLVADMARKVDGPSMMIIEAPMGEGKTEAALAAAELIAERGGDGGVVMALPTRATSDSLFRRFTTWLEAIPRSNGAVLDVGLAHGKNRYNPEFVSLLKAGFSCIDVDWRPPEEEKPKAERPELAVHRWLSGRKKIMLTQFMVTTIDQILFAALKGKHVVLRHLGLAGKVIIIDEAHAYDVYMSQYLYRVVEWLAGYGCSVVVLSATLPADKRAALVNAYQGQPLENERPDLIGDIGYPSVVAAERDGAVSVHTTVTAAERQTRIHIEYIMDDDSVLAGELRDALHGGGCVLVIRNTVKRAQCTADAFRDHFGEKVQVRLMHSRFIDPDRSRNDKWLRDNFGPDRDDVTPPTIVVATQVAEQSLDIDFDLLVTDLAPIDLILQRMGRIHRHERGRHQSDRPVPLRRARCLITGADWSTEPPEPAKGTLRVYDRYPVLRAAAVLADHLRANDSHITLPSDIAPLVQAAYGTGAVGPSEWQQAMDAASDRFTCAQAKKTGEAKQFQLDSARKPGQVWRWEGGAGDIDKDGGSVGRGQVRDGGDSIEVIVLIERDEAWYIPPWVDELGGAEVTRLGEPPVHIARAASQCTIALPFWLDPDRIIDELELHDTSAWQQNHWLAGELVLPLNAETLTTVVGDYTFGYDVDDGLTVELRG